MECEDTMDEYGNSSTDWWRHHTSGRQSADCSSTDCRVRLYLFIIMHCRLDLEPFVKW